MTKKKTDRGKRCKTLNEVKSIIKNPPNFLEMIPG